MAIKKKLVVVGYGLAGSQLVGTLSADKQYDITVVTPFEYQELPLKMTKVLAVGPEEHEKVLFDLLREKDVTYKIATCVSVNAKAIVLSDGSELPYDAAVIATGVSLPFFYPDPETQRTKESRRAYVADLYNKVKQANSIIISGGGAIGLETAADIKLRFPNKTITVVNAHETVSGMQSPFPGLVLTAVERMDINVILNDRVLGFENGKANLASGKTINGDLYIPAAVSTPYTQFMPPSSLDNKGFIKVNQHFIAEGFTNVFAFSACSNISRVKSAVHGNDQRDHLIPNLRTFLKNPSAPLKDYTPGFMGQTFGPMMLALGHNQPKGYGFGPALPGCMGWMCWACCCCGFPCSPPQGAG